MHRWKKLGRVFVPTEGRHPKLTSHAANPLVVPLGKDVYRVFYSGRDERNRSSVGAFDFDMCQLSVVCDHREPFFEFGGPGSFFADGVSIGNWYTVGDRRFILFMGWTVPEGEHWFGEIGRLELSTEATLSLADERPFMTMDETDPVSLSYPCVIQDDAGQYRMWYGSTHSWGSENGEMVHVLNGATSQDGVKWDRHGLAVPFALGTAQAFSRPTVARGPEGEWHMWFSYRPGTGKTYRIGYAHSLDGKDWTLDLENAGIDVSDDGWDSEMIEYPFVFDHNGTRYMAYNGNGFGRSGIGLAQLVEV